MRKTKYFARIKCGVLVLVCYLQLCLSHAFTVYASPDWPVMATEIVALSAIVIDADSGAVLYEKDADTLYPPASTAKIMTALVVMDHYKSMDDIITFSKEAADPIEADAGNKLGVEEGDRLTVRECMYSMLLCSSNQSANALAEYVAGDMAAFADMMNYKAKELGLTRSHFDNPSGLNGTTQEVTARELAMIAKAVYSNPDLLAISKELSYNIPPLKVRTEGQIVNNQHQLVKNMDSTSNYYYPPAVAGKTGYLLAAGNTLVTYAELNGRRLISVVLKGTPGQYYLDAKETLEFSFSEFENHTVSKQELIEFSDNELLYLEGQGLNHSLLSVSGGMTVTLPQGASPDGMQRRIAPLPAGKHPDTAVALLQYTYQDRTVGTVYITDSSPQPATDSLPDGQSQAPSDEADRNGQSGTPDGKNAQPDKKGNGPVIFLIVLLVLAAGGLGGLIYYLRQQEARKMKERHKKRQMRLEEMGISPEQFEELKNTRKKK